MSRKVTGEMVVGRDYRSVTRFKLNDDAKQDYCILIIDDEHMTRKLYRDILIGDGYDRVYTASNDTEVQKILDKTYPDLIIMDLDLQLNRPDQKTHDGFWMMEKIVNDWSCPTNFIIASGSFDDDLLREAMRHGAVDYIHKGNPEQIGQGLSVVGELRFKVQKALKDHEVASFAAVDPLTGLINKRMMYSEAGRRIADFIRDYHEWKKRGFPDDHITIDLSIAILDLDDFKKYNDTYGHMEGDYALKKMSNFLRTNLRRNDMICRFGGEEVVIVMPRTTFPSAVGLCNILSDRFKEMTLHPDGEKINISFTTGIVTWDGRTFTELDNRPDTKTLIQSNDDISLDSLVDVSIQAADHQLYRQKKLEKGRCSARNGFLPENIMPIHHLG